MQERDVNSRDRLGKQTFVYASIGVGISVFVCNAVFWALFLGRPTVEEYEELRSQLLQATARVRELQQQLDDSAGPVTAGLPEREAMLEEIARSQELLMDLESEVVDTQGNFVAIQEEYESLQQQLAIMEARSDALRHGADGDKIELPLAKEIDREYRVWYGTTRAPVDPSDIGEGFTGRFDGGDEGAGILHLGLGKVFVPAAHELGSTGSGILKRLVSGVDDRLKVVDIEDIENEEFWSQLNLTQDDKEVGSDSLVFLHGYNVTFDEALVRAAQLGVDLEISGEMGLFSFPSRGTFLGYAADLDNAEKSRIYLDQYLRSFIKASRNSTVNIIAHSMGNQCLLPVLKSILSDKEFKSKYNIGQVFLLAADIDQAYFRQLARAYDGNTERTTLYVSRNDNALLLSGLSRGDKRAGFFPPWTFASGVDTIDASLTDFGLIGHGYYAGSRSVLQDMFRLLKVNTPPDERDGLTPSVDDTTGSTYYQLEN